jgi:Fe-S-cluster containining protein
MGLSKEDRVDVMKVLEPEEYEKPCARCGKCCQCFSLGGMSPEALKEEHEREGGEPDIDTIYHMLEYLGEHKQNPVFPEDRIGIGPSHFYRCKLWDKEKGCTVYEDRPVMCRVHPTETATKLPGCTCGVMWTYKKPIRRNWRIPLMLRGGYEVLAQEKTIYVNPRTGEEYPREDILFVGTERPKLLIEKADELEEKACTDHSQEGGHQT